MGRKNNRSKTTSGEPPVEYQQQLATWLGSNDFSDNTITLYSIAARSWLSYAQPWEDGDWRVRSINWRKSLTNKAPKTQSVFISAAKSFVIHLIDYKVLESPNPFLRVRFRGLSSSYMKRRSLTDDEVRAMFSSCDLTTEIGLRDHTILVVMLHTALRIAGVALIDIEDIEKHGEMWAVKYRGKGQRGKDSLKALPPNVLMAIKAYLKKTDRTLKSAGPLFLSEGERLTIHGIRKSIVRRMKKCGIDDKSVTTHSLRHTAATKAIDSGVDIKAVQDLLDHASLATTDRYIHTTRRLDQAAGLSISYDTEEPDGGREPKKRPRKGKRPRRKTD